MNVISRFSIVPARVGFTRPVEPTGQILPQNISVQMPVKRGRNVVTLTVNISIAAMKQATTPTHCGKITVRDYCDRGHERRPVFRGVWGLGMKESSRDSAVEHAAWLFQQRPAIIKYLENAWIVP